ncbi:hypothetical protein [Mycobacteroides abscessus]|uniref:hypothetical protein n=1 Tax=Mycobacteroides abscessus TaxID=36809 RepID=UPI000709759C|nr:hypothetical protein [Mycobacteroides abscessus]ALM19078.1 hypothetical protein AOY11_25155 [Mycobacteroides abscessus]AMU49407.1 hypothetical protein A3O01_04030 [Mycobacteroides abscessus]ANO08079.1 hypothetical protein BAB76_04030 [Mycobacteroides abscessus]MDM3921141.1 hypothetical protein [Mycobacteroides abscessus]MDO2965018.1 hypothetical protein [Mycobacteroides abscessus subsp. abscessus]
MGPDDFFEETESINTWTGEPTTTSKLRTGFLNELRAGPVAGIDDLDAAVALTHLVWDDLIAFGTGGGNTLDDKQLTLAQRALTETLSRIGITLTFPWRDFTAFKSHWVRNGCSGSWQARRDLLENLFAPVQAELDRQEDAQFRAVNAEAVSPHTKTGWPTVDEELTELRRRFRTATTTQDYRDVGNRAVAVLEALSRTVYDPVAHLREGETEPPVDKTKQRIGRYVEDSLAGKDNEAIRGVVNKVLELAHSVKHSTQPTRREAGIIADSVIMLANILRRVDQDF